jgi:hemolysin activation/secretion protein
MRLRLNPIALALLTTFAGAAHGAERAPDAGQSIRDIQNQPLELPPKQTLELNLPEAPDTTPKVSGPTLQVNGFTVTGNTAIASDELLPLLADLQNRVVSLGELQAGAARITALYRQKGYPLARAYLPAQEIDKGVVTISVLEGQYGQVKINNQSRMRDFALRQPLAALQPGEAVHAAPLERSLLLLQQTPGVTVHSTLQPGTAVGATDLVVDVKDAALLSGQVDLDNYGNRFTGEYRLGGTLNLANPLGLGDQASVRVMGSDEDQHYYRAAYQLPIGPWSTQVGVAYSDMDYQLAKDFDELDAKGNARIATVFVQQPLIRTRAFSLNAQVQYDHKHLRDDIDLYESKSKKQARVITTSLDGNLRDNLLGGGVSAFSLAWSEGSLNLDGQFDKLYDGLTAKTAGRFQKINPSVVRLQRLSERFSLYGQVQGQWADGNLDSSEKISLGGAYGVRAYPQGEASGDQGYVANLELRYALTEQWNLLTFVDHGAVRLNKDTWADGENHRSLSATGVGANWSAGGWRLNTVAAWRVGNADPQSDVARTPRVWAQVSKAF